MDDPNDLELVGHLAKQIQDSLFAVIFENECIDSELRYATEIKKRLDACQETIRLNNAEKTALELEINFQEQQIKSFLNALESVNGAKLQYQKDLLLDREFKLDILKNTEESEECCEKQLLECKDRVYNIPFVRSLIETQNSAQNLEDEIKKSYEDAKQLKREINIKNANKRLAENKLIVELAEYVLNYMPSKLKLIEELKKQIEETIKEIKALKSEPPETTEDESINQFLPLNIKELFGMQRLQFNHINIDSNLKSRWANFGNLESSASSTSAPKQSLNKFVIKSLEPTNKEDVLYSVAMGSTQPTTTVDYSRRTLMNIYENVTVGNKESYDTLSKMNSEKLKKIQVIGSDNAGSNVGDRNVSENIDEPIPSSNNSTIPPPTQFLNQLPEETAEENDKVVGDLCNTDVLMTSECSDEEMPEVDSARDVTLEQSLSPEDNIEEGIAEYQDMYASKLKELLQRQVRFEMLPPCVFGRNTPKDPQDTIASEQNKNMESVMKNNKQGNVEAVSKVTHFRPWM